MRIFNFLTSFNHSSAFNKKKYIQHDKVFFILLLLFIIGFTGVFSLAYAEINVKILAVNGTGKTKDKEIEYPLPKELSKEDILSTDGLKLEYDFNVGSYVVKGKVTLAPKETKTYQVRINDVWKIDSEDIENLRVQIDRGVEGVKDIKGKDYTPTANILRDKLLERLDFIVGEHEKYSDNVSRRIDTFRIYDGELKELRSKSLSVSFWKSDPEELNQEVLKFVIKVENSKDVESTTDQKHYLPREVKPEHFIEMNGFEVLYAEGKETLYLKKEEVLSPREKKRYEFTIIDVWRVLQSNIDNLRVRSKEAFDGLKNSKYVETGEYLVASIEEKLKKVEIAQEKELDIYEHINSFRKNEKTYESAKKDVEALEALLITVREELEKSKLKNVLHKIKSLKDVSALAESLFKKLKITLVLKIILGIIIFVGVLTLIWFFHWKKRTKVDQVEDKDSEEQ